MTELSASAQKVQAALTALGLPCRVVELPSSTRSAQEAADSIGTTVQQIVKSLVFKGKTSGQAVLVEASGINRVSEKKVAALLGEPIEKADADFVRAHTGFVIGGVPPVGHAGPIRTFIDADLMQYSVIWAAAGTPNAVFELTPPDLLKMTGGQVADLKS
jgi:prolyl-tRNA editing enzyme YbaK/EbsC (Cys-tRNA(Pro) deacylase)